MSGESALWLRVNPTRKRKAQFERKEPNIRLGHSEIRISRGHARRTPMAMQIVMDPTGDTRHEFTTGDAMAVAKAERRFKQLTGAGFTAAVRTAEGHSKRIRDFDPAAEETIFFPRLQGG
jgi:hypothetical protein